MEAENKYDTNNYDISRPFAVGDLKPNLVLTFERVFGIRKTRYPLYERILMGNGRLWIADAKTFETSAPYLSCFRLNKPDLYNFALR